MKVDGQAVKKRRKQLHMTQNQLAEGICKQATISNIEKKNRMNSMSILVELCARLDLPISEVTKSTEEVEFHTELQSISRLLQSGKFVEAETLVNRLKSKEDRLSPQLKQEFYFYQGYLEIFFKKNESKGLFYLHKVVLTTDASLAIYRVLANTALLKFYSSKQMYPQAQSFLEDVLEELTKEGIDFDQRITVFYVEGAHYYLEIGEFKKGLDFCEKGLSICVENATLTNLEKLVEQKAKIMKETGDSTAESELNFAVCLKELMK